MDASITIKRKLLTNNKGDPNIPPKEKKPAAVACSFPRLGGVPVGMNNNTQTKKYRPTKNRLETGLHTGQNVRGGRSEGNIRNIGKFPETRNNQSH